LRQDRQNGRKVRKMRRTDDARSSHAARNTGHRPMEAKMLREHVINFLEAAVVLLLLTNVFSVVATAYAVSLARSAIRPGSPMPSHHALHSLAWLLRMGK
jgi:hypothetical protein